MKTKILQEIKEICKHHDRCLDCPFRENGLCAVSIPMNWDIREIKETVKEERAKHDM